MLYTLIYMWLLHYLIIIIKNVSIMFIFSMDRLIILDRYILNSWLQPQYGITLTDTYCVQLIIVCTVQKENCFFIYIWFAIYFHITYTKLKKSKRINKNYMIQHWML